MSASLQPAPIQYLVNNRFYVFVFRRSTVKRLFICNRKFLFGKNHLTSNFYGGWNTPNRMTKDYWSLCECIFLSDFFLCMFAVCSRTAGPILINLFLFETIYSGDGPIVFKIWIGPVLDLYRQNNIYFYVHSWFENSVNDVRIPVIFILLDMTLLSEVINTINFLLCEWLWCSRYTARLGFDTTKHSEESDYCPLVGRWKTSEWYIYLIMPLWLVVQNRNWTVGPIHLWENLTNSYHGYTQNIH